MELHLDNVDPDAPLLLATAAKLAFPDGSMTAGRLRGENRKGRLVVEHIGGRPYTTLNHIKAMRAKCRENQKEPGSIGASRDRAAPASGSYSTEQESAALASAMVIAQRLKKPSRHI